MNIQEQLQYLSRGCAEIISVEDLEAKLKKHEATGKPLRVKLGVDPTVPHVTLGWAVVLRKLRQFQNLGHLACLIIGDFTAMIGDPSGRSKTRPQLSRQEVEANVRAIEPQLFKILDPERTKIYYNSDWLGPMKFADVIQLASKITVARILERDDFEQRLAKNLPIGMHEILYPLCQGYDSVAIEADIELGGTDQKFNILVGRNLQEQYGQEPQVVMLMPLLIGLDGKEKMSQSLGNYIGITEEPNQIYGKTMSIPDHLIESWFTLCTDVPLEEVSQMVKQMAKGELNPRDAKRRLARELVKIYWGEAKAKEADEYFLKTFSQRETPEDVPEATIPESCIRDGRVAIVSLITALGLTSSNSEARRLIQQGGVSLGDVRLTDPMVSLPLEEVIGKVLRVGKHKFRKLKR
ncbi:MAG TPA: tyrosine--tRNA ligase [Fimbriimonadales bacterium]|nr:tyrosine--tRNA ligase [Fimbriimonadales bacterium]